MRCMYLWEDTVRSSDLTSDDLGSHPKLRSPTSILWIRQWSIRQAEPGPCFAIWKQSEDVGTWAKKHLQQQQHQQRAGIKEQRQSAWSEMLQLFITASLIHQSHFQWQPSMLIINHAAKLLQSIYERVSGDCDEIDVGAEADSAACLPDCMMIWGNVTKLQNARHMRCWSMNIL